MPRGDKNVKGGRNLKSSFIFEMQLTKLKFYFTIYPKLTPIHAAKFVRSVTDMTVERKQYCVNGQWLTSKTDDYLPVTDASTGAVM